MTLEEFVIEHNGEPLEVAGSANAKNQCVDLANGYIRDVLGLPIIEWTNAVDFPKKAGSNYEWILNTTTNVPREGDLIIFKGTIGHISVFLTGDSFNFKSFDQNYPKGSPCHVQDHNYNNVLGWLHPLKVVIDDMTQEEKIVLQKLTEFKNSHEVLKNGNLEGAINALIGWARDLEGANKQIQNLQGKVLDLERSQKTLDERLVALDSEIKANQDLVVDWQTKVGAANKTLAKKTKELEDAREEARTWKNRYENALTKFPSKYSWKDISQLIINKIKK